MSQTSAILEWTIPEEVQAFAEKQGVAAYLPAVLEATDRIFPNARRRAVVLEEDPEVAELRWIVIEVKTSLDVPQSIAARKQWHEAVRLYCPAPRICTFCLSMDLVK